MNSNELKKEIFDLTTDIDYAPLSVQLSLEDRKTLANTLLKLGYKKVNSGEDRQHWINKCKEAEYRAEKAERALLIIAREIMKARGYADSEIEYLAKEIYIHEVMKQAEKELEEGRKR